MTAACNHIIFWKCFKRPKVYEGRKCYSLKTPPLLYTTLGEDIMCFLQLCNGNDARLFTYGKAPVLMVCNMLFEDLCAAAIYFFHVTR